MDSSGSPMDCLLDPSEMAGSDEKSDRICWKSSGSVKYCFISTIHIYRSYMKDILFLSYSMGSNPGIQYITG